MSADDHAETFGCAGAIEDGTKRPLEYTWDCPERHGAKGKEQC